MSNSDERLAALEAEVKRLKAKQPKPPKSTGEYMRDLDDGLGTSPRHALDAELDKGQRAREVKELREVGRLIRKFGGTPSEYSREAFTRAWRASDYTSPLFESRLKSAAKLEAEEGSASGEGSE